MKKNNYNTYSQLVQFIKNSEKEYDLDLIEKAYHIALKAHNGQKRMSGVDYIYHPISVAYILVDLGMDTESITAALLHDVVEDTPVGMEQIKKEFSQEVVNLVRGVTKLGKIKFKSKEEEKAENIRKMFIAMAKDIRVIIIKLADRIHNMRTLECMSEQKQRDKSKETMEIFAPIAHRLGMRQLKEELEDLSLRYLDLVAYKEIEHSLALRKNDREKFISLIKKKIMDKIQNLIPNVYIEGRVKSTNGIYKKVFIKGKSIDEIYDVYAIRIIVNTVNDCYNVFGIVHDMFQPIPNRFKDYISMPKPNMYQSLHTTLMGKEGIPFEIQIRTWEMHRTAEYGIAAHWKYKLGMSGSSSKLKKNLLWVNKMVDEHTNFDVTDIIKNIKLDLVPEEVFVLTPRGKVISLPNGATVIDFAYAIHTDIGNKMLGAKVDKRIAPINYAVKTGEIVDIITTKDERGPNRNWLKIVKTGSARNKIKQWFKKEKREENIVEGKTEVEKELKRNNIVLSEKELLEILEPLLKRNQCKNIEDFYAAVGYGGIQFGKNMPRLKEEYQKKLKEKKKSSLHQNIPEEKPQKSVKSSNGVIVDGIDNVLVKFSKCCSPIPGDEIVGFVTRGSGIAVHSAECKNVSQYLKQCAHQKARLVKVRWLNYCLEIFKANIEILAENKSNLLANITKLLSLMNIKIISLNSRLMNSEKIMVSVTLFVKDLEHLKTTIRSINNLNGVNRVERR
ncbi:MAG: bifunctional (p)ppGpp synthetase/guanosine-3',5'-bis(diphosphate) 3'-pyrophosphohydrolase [Oscillospiraceae bacterium]|nr:bifunctional (p)ppGpp synthetase/guanosine-3',5'-bis(diphosphate) 3'-pyrophosphohydrolase [Oscillospiraceae bacterium]